MSQELHNNIGNRTPEITVVLGGCGFLGSHICRELAHIGHQVRIFDKLYAQRHRITDIGGEVEIVEGDTARASDVISALQGADTVVHLVHTTVPGSSMVDPSYDVESNVAASVRWLSRLGETEVRRIVFVSSGGTVYGVPQNKLIDERHQTDPICSYGITKLALEKYVAMYAKMAGVDYLILRPSNVYGEGQHLGHGQGVIGVLVDRALRGEPLEVWGTGENLRDYLYVADFIAALRRLWSYTGPQRTFNVSQGEGHSVMDIIGIIGRQLNKPLEVKHVSSRSFDVPINILDSSLLRQETGWEPQSNLADGIARVVRWLRDEQGAHSLTKGRNKVLE